MSFENPEDEFKKMQENAQERAEANVDPDTGKEVDELSKEHEEAERRAREDMGDEDKEAA